MLEQLKKLKGGQEGFTIIEVLIVLAIAGLIMVVVFLAVPNLEKSQRNNARDTDANNLLQSVSQYVGNADGQLPATCTSLTNCSWITYKPQQLTNVQVIAYSATQAAPNTLDSGADDAAIIEEGAVCNGLTPGAGQARDYVIWYAIEGSTGNKCTQGS